MFTKVKKWFVEGNKKSLDKVKAIQEGNADKVNKYLNDYRNSTGLAKASAKGKLFGTNKIARTFPQYKLDYVGGYFESPEGKENISIMLIDDGILFEHLPKEDLLPFSDISHIEFKSETDIQKDVTLTRMIAFGVYALALKKKKKTITHYLIIHCSRNGLKYAVCFAGDSVHQLYTDIFKKLV